jgi:hypothetical protein
MKLASCCCFVGIITESNPGGVGISFGLQFSIYYILLLLLLLLMCALSYYLSKNFVCIKFVIRNFQDLYHRHIFNCWLRSRVSYGAYSLYEWSISVPKSKSHTSTSNCSSLIFFKSKTKYRSHAATTPFFNIPPPPPQMKSCLFFEDLYTVSRAGKWEQMEGQTVILSSDWVNLDTLCKKRHNTGLEAGTYSYQEGFKMPVNLLTSKLISFIKVRAYWNPLQTTFLHWLMVQRQSSHHTVHIHMAALIQPRGRTTS